MARPNKVWYRKDTGWWMITLGGEKLKLVKGPNDPHHRQLAEESLIEHRRLQRESPTSPTARVADLVDAFLGFSKKRHNVDTYKSYRNYLQKFAEACGRLFVHDIRPHHVTEWVDGTNWSETTEYNARTAAFRVFSWAEQEGILRANPLKGMKKPQPRSRPRALTDDEYRELLRHSNVHFRRFVFALRNTGARPKELRTLQWQHVRADRFALTEHKTDRHTRKPRVIFLNAAMRRLIHFLRRHATGEHVFLNSRGGPWTKDSLNCALQRVKKKAKLSTDVCLYIARHAFATQAIVNGVDPRSLQDLLGHSSLDLISSVYVHLADEPSHLQEMAERATSTPRTTVRHPDA